MNQYRVYHMLANNMEDEPITPLKVAEIELGNKYIDILKDLYKKSADKSTLEIIDLINQCPSIQSCLSTDSICSDVRTTLKNEYILKVKYKFEDSEIPNTPTAEDVDIEHRFFNEFVMIFVSLMLGCIVNYDKEKKGKYVHNLYPLECKKNHLTDQGSAVTLGLHIEIASEESRPDFVILSCLRQSSPPTPTLIAKVSEALNNLKNEDIEALKKRLFLSRPPRSFGDNFEYRATRMIDTNTNRYYFNFNNGMVIPRNGIAESAFLSAKLEFENVKFPAYLFPGEILIIDNNQIMHGRANFKARFDGSDRWMQRTYVRK